MPPEEPADEKLAKFDRSTIIGAQIIDAITRLGEKLGIPISLFVFLAIMGDRWSSLEQKYEFFDLYILGKGLSPLWPLIIVSGLGAGAVLSIWRHYHKRDRRRQEEFERVCDQKSELQEKLAQQKLKHAKKGKSGGR